MNRCRRKEVDFSQLIHVLEFPRKSGHLMRRAERVHLDHSSLFVHRCRFQGTEPKCSKASDGVLPRPHLSIWLEYQVPALCQPHKTGGNLSQLGTASFSWANVEVCKLSGKNEVFSYRRCQRVFHDDLLQKVNFFFGDSQPKIARSNSAYDFAGSEGLHLQYLIK